MILNEPCYIFGHTGVLFHNQVDDLIKNCIREIKIEFKINEECEYIVNVVANREGKSFGHSYIWIQNIKIFNILIGLNLDGSLRHHEIEDPNWKAPIIPESKALEGVTDWSEISEIENSYEPNTLIVEEEPLFNIPGIEHSQEQIEMTGEEVGFVILSRAKFRDKNEKNILFSKSIPSTFDVEFFINFFKKFEKDKTIHISKNKTKFKYPLVNIKNNKLTIKFSPLYKNTAKFLVNIIKKIKLKNQLIFFSQVK